MSNITEPGVYPGLDYKDLPPGLSYSGAKDILKSPALYKHKRRQPKTPSDAMELGTITHAIILDTPCTWEVIDGGAGVTARRNECRARGLIPVTADALATAQAMAEAVAGNHYASELLARCAPERREIAAIAPDPATGVWMRCYFDALHDANRYGVDVKTGREGTLDNFAKTAADLGYDIQAAVYVSIMEWLGLPIEALMFVVVESTPPHFVGVRELDAAFVEMGRRKLRRALAAYAECVASDDWPGPAPFEKISAPVWALRQEGIT